MEPSVQWNNWAGCQRGKEDDWLSISPLTYPGSEYECYLSHEGSGVTKKCMCMNTAKRRNHVLLVPYSILAENVGKEMELSQSGYRCNWTEHVNLEKKGVLPTMYRAVRAGGCEQRKEEEHYSRGRVPEWDKGCELGRGRPNLSVQWNDWECVGIMDTYCQSAARLHIVFDQCKSIPAPSVRSFN